MGDQLREALIEALTSRKEGFKEYSLGWIKEKEAYKFIQPLHYHPWDLKDKRPFLIYKVHNSYVYFCLFSTSKAEFRCNKDLQYGIAESAPKMFFQRCHTKDSALCKNLRGESKLFKRMLDHGKCQILLRMDLRHFQHYVTVCGFCEPSKVPEKIKSIFKEEFREWSLAISEN